MDKIKDFIIANKFQIIVVILVSLIVVVLLVGRFTVEGMEVPALSKFVDKEIFLTYKDGGKVYYLSVASNANCGLAQDKDECSNNVVVLQETPDKHSRMILSFNPYATPKRYSIMSASIDIQPPYPQLAQSLNFRGVNKLCFENSTQDDVISFDIEESNGKYRIKYKKDANYYFIGVCDDKTLCNKLRRLCIYQDPAKAIYFDVEMAPIVTTEKFSSVTIVQPITQTPTLDDTKSYESLEGYDNRPSFGSDVNF